MTINRTSRKAQEERPTSGPSRGGPSFGLEDAVDTWATPTADDANNVTRASGQMQSLARDTTQWATPKASDGQGGRTTLTEGGGNAHLDIQTRAWSTPRAEDGERGQGSTFDGLSEDVIAWTTPTATERSGQGERNQALTLDVTAWATPKARDYKDGDSTGAVEQQSPDLGKEVVTFHRGPTPPPSGAQTAPSDSYPPKPRRRGLNPRFGLWLMGFPVGWLD